MSVRDSLKSQKNSQEVEDSEVTERKTVRESVQHTAKVASMDKPKPERLKWLKMWINYLVSLTMKDRGKIPDNIGDRILITNNTYITKLYMTTIIHVYELGVGTPVTFMGMVNNALRDRGNRAIVDCTCKNKKYMYDPKNSGLASRIRVWENNLNSDMTSRKMKDRSTRCLFTVKMADSGVQLKNTRMFLQVRAKDINTLNQAEKIIFDLLRDTGSTYMPAHSTIRRDLEYISLIGNRTTDVKGITPVMTSNIVLSQLIANTGSYNDRDGYYLGMNVRNGSHYYVNMGKITVARNMLVVSKSGVGKTALAMNIAQSAYESGSAVSMMDIKGNEFVNFAKATNGYIISLRPTSIEFINSWVMRKEDTSEEHAEAYFKSRVQFSKQQMIILSGIRDREKLLEFEELLDEFHSGLYNFLGVTATNMNSWSNTLNLHPYEVFERFLKYLTPEKWSKYSISKSVIGTLRMYMSESGTKSYVFKREFDYNSILNAKTLVFDFGLLGQSAMSDTEVDLFRLKFLYTSRLNSDFTTRKYAEGLRTLKILEESQVVSPEIMEMYVQEYTLRRSQMQDTLLLGNSVLSLAGNENSKPLIENTTGLFIGELTLDARNALIEQFGLQHLSDHIKLPGSAPKYKNCFVFINNMQNKKLYPILQIQLEKDEETGKPREYKVNTPVKEVNVLTGSSGE
ncbi:MAG: hypothetical protein IKL53_01170 [Lachnospiraceae bacterium]|nr:hypothetical protein [Lachnospiraceae bacterium]